VGEFSLKMIELTSFQFMKVILFNALISNNHLVKMIRLAPCNGILKTQGAIVFHLTRANIEYRSVGISLTANILSNEFEIFGD
jgi:hypothetical protein